MNSPELLVPLKRVLPVVGSNVGMAAHRLVRGRLRLFVRTGLRIYVSQEDYLSLCEAAWDIHVRKSIRVRHRDIVVRHGPAARPVTHEIERTHTLKPIHDGRPLDRYRKGLLYRLMRAITRWWRATKPQTPQ